MNMAREPKQWLDFPARLPLKCNRHTVVAYQKRLIITGGEDANEGKVSDSIYEASITPPHTSSVVCRMPQPRVGHGAVLYNDKMLIVGGRTTNRCKDGINSVLLYDINKRKCKEMAPLPYEVSQMAIVRQGDNLLVIGGQDNEGSVLDKVVLYDIETGKCRMLPSMNVKRAASTAAVIKNVVLVMGGRDEEKNYLKSVEYFDIDRQEWKGLPPMSIERTYATSAVSPVA